MVRSPSLAKPRSVGQQPQERSGPVSFASGMITHCQIMGQELRIALTDPWLSLLFASADIVLPCTLAAPAPFDARVAGADATARDLPFTGPGSCSTTARLAPLRRR